MALTAQQKADALAHLDSVWGHLNVIENIVQPALEQLTAIAEAIRSARDEIARVKQATGIE